MNIKDYDLEVQALNRESPIDIVSITTEVTKLHSNMQPNDKEGQRGR